MIKILIVDDECIMRQGIRFMVPWEKEGFQIVGEATNGLEALELVDKLSPHIVLTDVVMPLMDGMDFVSVLHRKYPNIQIIVLSGYDKFEYVKETLTEGASDYILKPTLTPDILLQAAKSASQRLPQSLLTDNESDINDVAIELEKYLLENKTTFSHKTIQRLLPYQNFILYGFYTGKIGRVAYDLMVQRLKKQKDEAKQYTYVHLYVAQDIALIIYSFPDNTECTIYATVSALHKQLTTVYPTLFGVCTLPISSVRELKKSYYSVFLPKLKYSFYFPNKELFFCKKELPGFPTEIKFPFYEYCILLNSHQYHKGLESLQQYVTTAFNAYLDIDIVNSQVKHILFQFLDTISIDENYRDVLRNDFFTRLDSAPHAEHYQSVISDIIGILSDVIATSISKDKRINEILDYIEKNYQEEMYLEDIATKFNFNYSYLSSYFSAQTRESFRDYLNRIRIKHACEHLLKNELSISQISNEVGYSDHSYFCRVFRKITGKTPSEWRKSQ